MNAEEIQKQTYESDKVLSQARYHDARIRNVRTIVGELPPGKLLDVGCANGEVLKPLLSKHSIHGVDVSEVEVERARANGLKAEKINGDSTLPYEDKVFDYVFSGETIEHIVDTDLFLSEINRVLKPNGTVILTMPNIRTLLGIGMMLCNYPPMYAARYRSPHFRDFTTKTLRIALEINGLIPYKWVGTSFYLPGMGETLPGIARFFPSWSHSTIVCASKSRDVKYDKSAVVAEIYG